MSEFNDQAGKFAGTAEPPPPARLKYLIAGVLMMLCIGNVYAWSVFAKPLQGLGWSASETTLPFQLSIVIFAIAMIFAGRMQDKIGPKPVAVFSGITMGIGFILIKFFGQTQAGMIVCFSLIVGIGMGAGYVTPLATALKWYPDKRGLISGLVVMGMGAGSIFGGMGGPLLIERIGVWNTFAVFGLAFGAIITGSGFILKNPPAGYRVVIPGMIIKNGGAAPKKDRNNPCTYDYSAREMLSTLPFYLIWLVFIIGTGGGLMIISQASPFGQSIVGLSPVVAGSVIMIIGIFNGLGRPSFGSLSDKIGRRNAVFLAFGIQLIALLFFLPNADSYLIYALGVSFIGFSYGGFLALMPTITADYYGIKNVGLNYAWVYTGWGAAGYFGPQVANILVGGSVERSDWNNAFYFIAAVCAVGMILWFFTRQPVKTRGIKPDLPEADKIR